VAISSPHKLNLNLAISARSYGNSINLHQQSNTSGLLAGVSSLSVTSARYDHVHTSSGQNLPTTRQSGATLDISKPFTQAEETSLISADVLQMKSCSTSSTTQRIYGSTPLAIFLAIIEDIFGSQSTTVTELSATKKSSVAVKNLQMNMPTP